MPRLVTAVVRCLVGAGLVGCGVDDCADGRDGFGEGNLSGLGDVAGPVADGVLAISSAALEQPTRAAVSATAITNRRIMLEKVARTANPTKRERAPSALS
jgi:hypothetical protein